MSMVHEMRMMTGEIYSINWLHIQYFSGVFLQQAIVAARLQPLPGSDPTGITL